MRHDILPLLRCPASHEALLVKDELLIGQESGFSYPIIHGCPIFLPAEARQGLIIKEDHISNILPEEVTRRMIETAGLVLNLSAGGTSIKPGNSIEVEYSIFHNTDVVADAHNLPFRDSVFSGIVCMNAFEHYRQPHVVANELHRVLKPNGWILIHTAFIQPIHEAPYHFFNCTKYGLAEWFQDFQDVAIEVSANFHPLYGLSWLLSDLDLYCYTHCGHEASAEFQKLSLGEVINFWRDSATREDEKWSFLKQLPQLAQENLAAGYQLTAIKR
jgi:SAM-dependent methyltransferase